MRQLILTFSCIGLLLTCRNVYAQNEPIPTITIPQEQLATRQQAILDANQDVEQYVSGTKWFLLGALGGIFTYFYVIDNTPAMPTTRLLGKSAEYLAFYTVEYQSKAKNKRLKSSCLGWGTFSLLYATYLGVSCLY